jgi:hypothetical protein
MSSSDADGNCSIVWMEPLAEKVPLIPPIKPSSMNPDLTKYETRIAQLEKDQRLVELKIKTQNELLKENNNLIHEWIIPTLELIFFETDSLKNRKEFAQHMDGLLKRAEKSFNTYKKLE